MERRLEAAAVHTTLPMPPIPHLAPGGSWQASLRPAAAPAARGWQWRPSSCLGCALQRGGRRLLSRGAVRCLGLTINASRAAGGALAGSTRQTRLGLNEPSVASHPGLPSHETPHLLTLLNTCASRPRGSDEGATSQTLFGQAQNSTFFLQLQVTATRVYPNICRQPAASLSSDGWQCRRHSAACCGGRQRRKQQR